MFKDSCWGKSEIFKNQNKPVCPISHSKASMQADVGSLSISSLLFVMITIKTPNDTLVKYFVP